MADQVSAGVFDFTNVKDGGQVFSKKRIPEGDYKAKVIKVVDAPAKKDDVNQWLFTIQIGANTYPYYCKHEENQYWKIRNLLLAAGMTVPKKKVKVDPNRLVGKFIAVTMADAEYNGKAQSEIADTFPVSELNDDDIPDEPDDVDDDEDTPPPKKKAQVAQDDDDDDDDVPALPKKKKAPEPEPEEDEDDPLEALDRSGLKSLIAEKSLEVKVFKSMSDDDIRNAIRALDTEEEEEEPAPPPKKKKAAPVEDDDLEEIDIDDT